MVERCPDVESLAAYLDGKVGRSERRNIEAHLASCEECCHVTAEVVGYKEEAGLKPASRHDAARTPWLAAAAVLLAATALWFFRPELIGLGARRPAVRGVGPLVSALEDRRFIDARVSGGFAWAPLEAFGRSGAGARSTPSWEVLSAAAAIRKDADVSPTTENLHALGIAHFVLGDLDEAVAVLRRVVQESELKAKPLSDLGAALIDRGERKGRPDDLVEALACIEKSLASDPTLGEALFNRAVALEKLHLDERAVNAWGAYLERTSEPGWRDEARRRLERLKAPKELGAWEGDRDRLNAAIDRGDATVVATIVARRTQETRLWIEGELLGAWALAAMERPAESDRILSTAEVAANALFVRTGDPMPRDEVAFTRDAVSRPDGSDRLAALIRGRVAYHTGLERYRRYEIEEALPYFREAQSVLSSIADPVTLAAALSAARCEYYRGVLDLAERRLDEIAPAAERNGYQALAAHVHWMHGLIDGVRNRFGESLARYRQSLAMFQRLGEEEHVAFVSSLLAEILWVLGDERESLRLDLDAVARLARVREPGRAVAILEQVALSVAQQGFPEVALQFQDEAVERALATGDAIDATDSLLQRAPIAFAANRLDAAARDIDESRVWMGRVQDASLRRRLEAEVRFAEGRLARARLQPVAAVSVLSDAIEFFKNAGLDARLPALFLERAKASRAAGDSAAAERDLQAAIGLLETHRASISDPSLRVSYFDTARDLFDELVGLQHAGGRPEDALTSLERGKTRDLLDRLPRAGTLDRQKLEAMIPAGVVVIEYGVLPDRLLIWTLARGSRFFSERPIDARDLAACVNRFRDELDHSRDGAELVSGARLREILVDPVASYLGGKDTVVFVPDDVLHAVPFAALRNPKSGRFLVEERSIIVAPSVALYLRASSHSGGGDRAAPPTLLAVGDPAFDAAAYPYLPRLSTAAGEAKRIATLYSDSLVLVGKAATRASVLEAMGRYSVVHVAAHALGNESDPSHSRLLLAPDAERHDAGLLFADELYGRSLKSVRVVVLAACATASGRTSRGEGPLSLARPFLADGVPVVLATLWDIEDEASSELIVRFHRELAQGRAPEAALRDAQEALIESPNAVLRNPRIWAAFELVGGSAPRSNADARKEG